MRHRVLNARRQGGATVVEFALVLLVFLTFFLGILDLARLLFTWNASSQATHLGARYAAVCDDGSRKAQVLAKVQQVVPQIQDIRIQWSPAGCAPGSCTGVQVQVSSLQFQWISPLVGSTSLSPLDIAPLASYLPREAMRQDTHSDALCTDSL